MISWRVGLALGAYGLTVIIALEGGRRGSSHGGTWAPNLTLDATHSSMLHTDSDTDTDSLMNSQSHVTVSPCTVA